MIWWNIIDDKGFTWCRDKGFFRDEEGRVKRGLAYWGHRKFALDDEDWEKRKAKMFITTAIVLTLMMWGSGLNVFMRRDGR